MPHTPGPWYYCENLNGNGAEVWSIKSDSETHLGVVAALSRIPDSDLKYGATLEQQKTQESNARLIAAAPELLEALRFYANPDNWKEADTGIGPMLSEVDSDFGTLAKEAIRKAIGQ